VLEIPVPVVLASLSPARRELLKRLLARFDVMASGVDEDGPLPAGVGAGTPEQRAVGLAQAKARRVSRLRSEALVIGADTVVVCRDEVLGKPAGFSDAARMLRQLTTTPHRVVTGVCLVAPDGRERSFHVTTGLRMRPMSDAEVRRYARQRDVLNWAGAYALAADDPNVQEMHGSDTNVMGLPLERLEAELKALYPARESARGLA